LEIKEIIERIDCVKHCISRAFDEGTLNLDAIINELEALKPPLELIGDKLNNSGGNPAVSAPCLEKKPTVPRTTAVNAEDYR